MKSYLWIGLGSGLGGVARYLTTLGAGAAGGLPLVAGTATANLGGSLLIGFLAGRWGFSGDRASHPALPFFWITGFCGGYTTFSLFSVETLGLLRAEGLAGAAGYVILSLGGGLAATLAGLLAGSRTGRRGKAGL